MKIVAVSLLLLSFISQSALGDCDWSKGITPGPNNTYVYSEACHLEVGKLVQAVKTKDAQIADLTKAISLKDLAIDYSDKRIQLWQDTNFKLEDRLSKIDSLERTNSWLYFGLGAITVLGAGFMASRLMGK